MVYSELRGQAPTTSDSGVGVHSADGFIVEQYSRVCNAELLFVGFFALPCNVS